MYASSQILALHFQTDWVTLIPPVLVGGLVLKTFRTLRVLSYLG